ncbi:MAG: Gfo/Idh/MocA family oxidoreductase [Clostridiales bacterium]|nr:Gfo/Idh/MocA family oxidoreductase [Clostridiales bacterium]
MQNIRIGIIGTGIIAHAHLDAYQRIPGVQVVAACDILEDKLAAFCDKYDIPHRYADFRKMLERDDLDAVDICVHNNLHMPLAVRVLRAGFHCYCEKPMAGAYIDARHMLDVARQEGKKLHIQLAFLYHPQTHAAKKLIDDGQLGKIYHARSYGYRRRGRPFVDGYGEKEFDAKAWAAGGALYDMGVYHISQLLYLLGNPRPERISGQVYQELAMDEKRRIESGFDVEELGCGFVKFDGGLTMDILESWAIHGGAFPPSMIAGSKGGLSFSSQSAGASGLTYYQELSGYPMACDVSVGDEQYRTRQLNPALRAHDGSQDFWVAALRGECAWPGFNTAEVALNTMLISEGIYMSSVLGREVSADEVIGASTSQAMTHQNTPFGVIEYGRE